MLQSCFCCLCFGCLAWGMWDLSFSGIKPETPCIGRWSFNTGLPRESLSYFLESVGLCLLPNLGSFQPLFLQIPFPVYSVLSPCFPRILMIWMLSLLLYSQEFLSLYFFFFKFPFCFSYWANSIDHSSISLIHSSIVSTTMEPIHQVYCSFYHIFQFYNLHLVNFYYFHRSAEVFWWFPICFRSSCNWL